MWTGAAWLGVSGSVGTPLVAIKSAGQNSTSSTLANDDHLFLTLPASVNYNFLLQIQYTTPAAADFKYDFDYTGTLTAYREWGIHTVDGTTLATTSPHLTLGTDSTILHGSLAEQGLLVMGSFLTSTAGSFRFRWAQNSASGTTTVRSGGILRAWRNA